MGMEEMKDKGVRVVHKSKMKVVCNNQPSATCRWHETERS